MNNEIPYTTRSRFLPVIEECLCSQRNSFTAGYPVCISLESGGYSGDTIVVVQLGNSRTFQTDWQGKDPTRFPQRIRAAATALRNYQFEGRFRITHKDGALRIQAI